MRKRLTKFHYEPPRGEPERHWIDIEQIATVEVTQKIRTFRSIECSDRQA